MLISRLNPTGGRNKTKTSACHTCACISIHTSTREVTSPKLQPATPLDAFQPTRPRGARPRYLQSLGIWPCSFYPHTLTGTTAISPRIDISSLLFQSARPYRARPCLVYKGIRERFPSFNPRTHPECDYSFLSGYWRLAHFNPRARRGAT